MSSFSFKQEYFQVYTGEDRTIPLRVVNIDGTPFSLVGVSEIEARFKKADGSVLSKKKNPASEVTKYTFIQAGSFYDIASAGKALQLYSTNIVGHYFWFKVTDGTNTQTAPSLVGTAHQVSILKLDTAAQIATKFFTAVNLLGLFSSVNNGLGVITLTNTFTGSVPDASGSPSNAQGIAATISVSVNGYDSAISVVDDVLGKYSITLKEEDTLQLLIGERQTFTIVFTFPTGKRKVNYRNLISVDRQVV